MDFKEKLRYYTESNTDECLPYPSLNSDGYGVIQSRDKNGKKLHISSHRKVYELFHNVILTSDEFVCHHCDNPPCCNPKHLFKGNPAINAKDRDSKGRQAKGEKNGRYLHGYNSKYNPVQKPLTPFKELCGRSLTKEQVIQIKKAIKNKGNKSLKTISDEFMIKYQTIRDISINRIYKSVFYE